MLRVLDIFSGIGGFSLGLERTGGFKTQAFCEIDPFCRKVLAKHWPDVPCYEDVRTLTADALSRDGIAVDVICGGFPCQDVSFAGRRAGLEGEWSGLWSEYRRLLGELRPRFAIAENVPGLLSLGMARVLGDLAEIGFDAVWDCIPASAIGAPHQRDRVWIVAHASGEGRWVQSVGELGSSHTAVARNDGAAQSLADADGPRRPRERSPQPAQWWRDPIAAGRGTPQDLENSECRRGQGLHDRDAEPSDADPSSWWATEPAVGRVADGLSDRVDQLRAYGNSVVPQIPEIIGRAILEAA
jgi:DNA (cytosine-5)-methyltransferase 1